MTVINVKKAYELGDFKTAMQGVKDWRLNITKSDKKVISRGYECIVHPAFYISLGIDIERAIEEAKIVLSNILGV